MKHQVTGLEKSEGKRNFAFLMEQGTGKTWLTIADVERCFEQGKIDGLAVIAPNGVHTNWVRREIPTHMSVSNTTYAWRGTPKTKKAIAAFAKFNAIPFGPGCIKIFAMNIDAINTANGYEAMEKYLESGRIMLVVDESNRIKNPGAKRTEKVIELGRKAIARRILSGAPITKGPPDLFSQFDFLKPGLLGTTSYRAFMSEYSVLLKADSFEMQAILRKLAGKTKGIPQVVATDKDGNKMWKNLDRLGKMLLPHSYRVTKADCLDLPPKVYQTITFELEPKQRIVYDRLKDDYHYNNDGDDMKFEAIATRTKMKQVTSGFINVYGEATLLASDQRDSARMAAFKEAIEDVDCQFIVWAMFGEEINQIMDALAEAGIDAVRYDGATSKDDREQAIDDFQAGRKQAFVSQAQAGGIGITLTAAELAIYYSCSFDNDLRLQSEDRCHRIGTTKTVTYVDLIAEDTIDEDVAQSLAQKNLVAFTVIDKPNL